MNAETGRLRGLACAVWRGMRHIVRLSGRIRLLWLLAALTVVAYFLLTQPQQNTSFSIHAATEVLEMHVPCGMRIVWDLPPGTVQISDQETLASDHVSAVLRSGVQARIWRGADDHLRIRWGLSDIHACRHEGSTGASAMPSIDPEPLRLITEHGDAILDQGEWEYVSASSQQAERRPVLIVAGYIVVGGPIVQGAGYGAAVSMPMLLSGGIEARTPDSRTQQQRLIHSEQVEVGTQIDSHGCLSVEPEDLASCVRKAGTRAQGFVHLDDTSGSPALGLQLAVEGEQVGVRQFGSVERRIVVLRWARLLSSSGLQILAVMSAALLTVIQLTSALTRTRYASSDREE